MMENLTLVPRKQYNSNLCLARFLHENTDFVRDEFFIFGYIFHKSVRTVTLYMSDAQKNLDDCVYIFACEDKTKLSDRSGGALYKEYHEMFILQFLFKWRDLHLLSAHFSVVNKMFRWCDIHDGYN